MPNLLQTLARASLNRSTPLAAAAALLLLAPLATFAAETEIIFRGQKIWVEGVSEADGTIKWIGDKTAGDAELLLIYKNSDAGAVNTLRTSVGAEARVLVVGGGGAGGYGTTTTTNPGGGGGGGEVIELENNGTRRGNSAPFLYLVVIWKLIRRRKIKLVNY